ncbi:MAG: hypothetical protein AAFR17_07290 [Pseudomonadota bacterium]
MRRFCLKARLRLAFLLLWFGGWGLAVSVLALPLAGTRMDSALVSPEILLAAAGLELMAALAILAVLLRAALPCGCTH